jgi:hypothetical protein
MPESHVLGEAKRDFIREAIKPSNEQEINEA